MTSFKKALGAGALVAMWLGASLGPAAADDGWGAADAGSLGATATPDVWCVVDASSLGVADALELC